MDGWWGETGKENISKIRGLTAKRGEL